MFDLLPQTHFPESEFKSHNFDIKIKDFVFKFLFFMTLFLCFFLHYNTELSASFIPDAL